MGTSLLSHLNLADKCKNLNSSQSVASTYSSTDFPVQQSRRQFLYIAMMSADNLISSRGKAAAETWISTLKSWNAKENVKVEIFAQSDMGPQIGVNIIKMNNVSDHVYPPQKVNRSFNTNLLLVSNVKANL